MLFNYYVTDIPKRGKRVIFIDFLSLPSVRLAGFKKGTGDGISIIIPFDDELFLIA